MAPELEDGEIIDVMLPAKKAKVATSPALTDEQILAYSFLTLHDKILKIYTPLQSKAATNEVRLRQLLLFWKERCASLHNDVKYTPSVSHHGSSIPLHLHGFDYIVVGHNVGELPGISARGVASAGFPYVDPFAGDIVIEASQFDPATKAAKYFEALLGPYADQFELPKKLCFTAGYISGFAFDKNEVARNGPWSVAPAYQDKIRIMRIKLIRIKTALMCNCCGHLDSRLVTNRHPLPEIPKSEFLCTDCLPRLGSDTGVPGSGYNVYSEEDPNPGPDSPPWAPTSPPHHGRVDYLPVDFDSYPIWLA